MTKPSMESEDSLPREEITLLLHAWGKGSDDALEELIPAVYLELRQMARRALRGERQDHTLEPTALVHEAYFRLSSQERIQWRNREQFLGISAQLMRRILVDHARRKQAAKRGGERFAVTLEDGMALAEDKAVDLIVLDDALERLRELDPRQAKIVEMRYFAGLKIDETATALGVSVRTVKREWQMARAWLRREVTRSSGGG